MKKKNVSSPLYELKNIQFTYTGVPVLQDITVSIKTGERVAILGANGSGKSTLIKLLAGLEYPTKGVISFYNQKLSRDFFSIKENEYSFRRQVGYVFQDSDVQLFCQSVWDEVTFGPLHLEILEKEVIRRSDDALHALGISHLKDRSPYTLSGGEKKKVAIASVLSMQPTIWIFDEPTASLDPRTQSMLFDIFQHLHEQGSTVIVTTHDLLLLEELADRVILLSEDHRIVADDSPRKILKNKRLLQSHNLVHRHDHGHGKKHHRHVHLHTTVLDH